MRDKAVIPKPKPAVIISGGIDSAIVLHHLLQKTKENVQAYTIVFDITDNVSKEAKEVAEYHGVSHKIVMIR